MADLQWFNASQHTEQPMQSFEPLPRGSYEVAIIESEMQPTKKGDGKKLAITLEVLTGTHKGRRIWESLNVVNQNSKAQEIALGMLSSICRAVNCPSPRDSADLHNRPMMAEVIIDEYQSQAGEKKSRNKVLRFFANANAAKTQPQPKPAPKQPASPPEPNDDDIPF